MTFNVVRNGHQTRVQILDLTVCISHRDNYLWDGETSM